MATTGHWYINPDGDKVDFVEASDDIDFDGDDPVASVEIRFVDTTDGGGGSEDHPTVLLWRAPGAVITTDEITAAIADQDDAAVPALDQAADPPSGTVDDAITAPTALGAATAGAPGALTSADATGGEAPTEVEYNALRADVAALRQTAIDLRTDRDTLRTTVAALVTAVNALITSAEDQGAVEPN